jgi:hypothetical protein
VNADAKRRQVMIRMINIRYRIIGLIIALASVWGFFSSTGVTPFLFVISGSLGFVVVMNTLTDNDNDYR